eukprot:970304-Prorocentrum_minimum.AAC.1
MSARMVDQCAHGNRRGRPYAIVRCAPPGGSAAMHTSMANLTRSSDHRPAVTGSFPISPFPPLRGGPFTGLGGSPLDALG